MSNKIAVNHYRLGMCDGELLSFHEEVLELNFYEDRFFPKLDFGEPDIVVRELRGSIDARRPRKEL